MAVAKQSPGALDVLYETARRIERLERSYRDKHWGDPGDLPAELSTVPDVDQGCEVLGELAEIGYLTRKGRRATLDLWVHEFSDPPPLLCVSPDGKRSGLVIVRGHSQYTVNRRGIVG